MQHNSSSQHTSRQIQITEQALALMSFGEIIKIQDDNSIKPENDDVLICAKSGRNNVCPADMEPTDAQFEAAYYIQLAAMGYVNAPDQDWLRLHVLDNLDCAHIELTGIRLFIRPDTAPSPIN